MEPHKLRLLTSLKIKLLADTKTAVAHCPSSNMLLAPAFHLSVKCCAPRQRSGLPWTAHQATTARMCWRKRARLKVRVLPAEPTSILLQALACGDSLFQCTNSCKYTTYTNDVVRIVTTGTCFETGRILRQIRFVIAEPDSRCLSHQVFPTYVAIGRGNQCGTALVADQHGDLGVGEAGLWSQPDTLLRSQGRGWFRG